MDGARSLLEHPGRNSARRVALLRKAELIEHEAFLERPGDSPEPATLGGELRAQNHGGTRAHYTSWTRVPLIKVVKGERLPLGDTARKLLDLLLRGAARLGPFRLGSGLLAGGALHFLTCLFVYDFGGIGHLVPLSVQSFLGFPQMG